jgi:hypothetical protein
MELFSIILCISAIYQKLVQQIWCPAEHYTLCALCNYCYNSCWGFFLSALPQKFASHQLCGKLYCMVIDILYDYSSGSPICPELCFHFLCNLFIPGFIVQIVFWIYTTGRKPIILAMRSIYGNRPVHPQDTSMYHGH